jgi:hypothetical protein
MGTRSDIIVQRKDGTWARIYCHWDGYLEHNGVILLEHYNTQELAEAVVAPGDMSSLKEKCDKPAGHSYDHQVEGHTVYYGRDRGETNVGPRVGDSLPAVWPGSDTGTEYTYVWKTDSGWWVGDADEGSETLVPLKQAIEGKVEPPKPNVKAFGGNFVIGARKI